LVILFDFCRPEFLFKKIIFASVIILEKPSLKFNSQQKHLKKWMGLEDEMTFPFGMASWGAPILVWKFWNFWIPKLFKSWPPKQITHQNDPHQK